MDDFHKCGINWYFHPNADKPHHHGLNLPWPHYDPRGSNIHRKRYKEKARAVCWD